MHASTSVTSLASSLLPTARVQTGLQHAAPEFIAWRSIRAVNPVTTVLLVALIMLSQVGAEPLEQVLWQEGEDKYRELVATVQHMGTCQPECDEERLLLMPSDVHYDVRIDVLLADMHSAAEHVTVRLGSIDVMCNPMPASDYNCSMSTCAEHVVLGPAGASGLYLKVSGQRMRDTCKCTIEDNRTVDCYSMLLSGLDETYGLLVRLTFTPLTDVRWVIGPWQPCDLKDCIQPSSVSRRTVQCFMVDSGSNVGIGASGSSILPDSPSWHWCAGSAPPSVRTCADVPECAAPPLCRGCFSLALVAQPDLWWSKTANSDAIEEGLRLGVSETGTLSFRLQAGLADASGISISTCTGGEKIIHGSLEGNSSAMLLAADVSSSHFNEHATFHLRHVAAAVYAFDSLDGSRSVAAVDKNLRLVNDTEAALFAAWDAEGLCGLAVPGDMSRYACQFSHGWCCNNPLDKEGRAFCQIGQESSSRRACPVSGCSSPGYALLSKGHCADLGCAPIKDHKRCEIAAQSFGLRLLGGARATAEILITSYQPSFCVWEPESINNEGAALWFNAHNTTLSSTPEFRQLCQCGGDQDAADRMRYFWSTGDWSECSLSCGVQKRTRTVVCLGTTSAETAGDSGVQVPTEECRKSGLEEPPHSEPCTTPMCFKSQANTRCAGKERPVEPHEIGPAAKRIEGVTGGQHCIELHLVRRDAEQMGLCRRSCSRMGDCAAFTFYEASASRKYAQCCFLQRATRWEANFGHAVCHLAHGLRTHGGCTCQVGWAHDSPSGARSVCGAGRGGCCTTADSGALSWCPTTSSSCGKRSQGQQHWDFCDPKGLAVITENTCSSNPFLMHRGCVPARSVSQCNQIATALGLPDTTPTVTLSMHMPSACVWQSASSQLWLNQLVGAVNATNPSQIITVRASPELLELCSCPPEVFRWEVGEWSSCFRAPESLCGEWKRSRSIFCIQEGIHGIDGSGDVVADAFCDSQQPPPETEMCTGCSEDVVRAELQFTFQRPQKDLQSQTLEKACQEDLAWAMGIEATRVRVIAVACCTEQVLLFDLLISGAARTGMSSVVTAGDALERLIKLARSPLDRSRFQWSSWFRPFAAHMSLRVLGVYSWENVGEWSDCDAQCGGGTQRRTLQCIFRDYKSPPVRATSEFSCDIATRPEVVRVCSIEPCRHCPGFVPGSHYAASGGGHGMAHGDSVYVTCAAGFATADDVMLVGSTCDDGHWTPLGVSCGRSCPTFEVASWKYAVKGTGLLHGATRQVWCRDHPPSTVLEVPPSVTVVCEDGSWSRPVLACTGDCQEIELSDKYFVSGVNSSDGGSYAPHGAVRHVACAPGFSSPNGSTAIEWSCNEGQWSTGTAMPECKADCPRYQLPEGYEVEHDNDQAEQDLSAEGPTGSNFAGLQNANISRRPSRHGTFFDISCAHGYTRMPGAIEHVQCIDGQWSALSLVCRKNCPRFNVSSLDQRRYKVVPEQTLPDLLDSASGPQGAMTGQGVVHGSVVTIGCQRPDAAHVPVTVEQEELRCENGAWSAQQLQCFHSCSPFVAGPQYIVSMLGLFHGARLLATCADGFSEFRDDTNQTLRTSLIDEAECADGNWTPLGLHCTPDCPPLKPGINYVVSGEGLKHGSMQYISCRADRSQFVEAKKVIVQCSEAGAWHLGETLGDPPVLQVAEESLDLDHIPLDCPMPHTPAEDKLDSSDKDAIGYLVVSFCIALCGFLGSLLLVRRLKSERSKQAAETSGRGAALSSFEDSDPLQDGSVFFANFDDYFEDEPQAGRGDQEVVHSTSSRSLTEIAGRLGEAARRRLESVQVQEQQAQEPGIPICQCGEVATHMCFPCNHLSLCVTCAGEVARRSLQGDVTRCPKCYGFVDCAIDARPAAVFETPRSLFLHRLQQMGQQLRQLPGVFRSGSASSAAPNAEVEDPAIRLGESEFVHGGPGCGVRQLQPSMRSPTLSSREEPWRSPTLSSREVQPWRSPTLSSREEPCS